MSDMITAEERLYPHKQMWRLTDKFRPLLQAYGRVWEKQASLICEGGGSPREALDEEVDEVEAPIIAAIAEIETALHTQLADAKAAQALVVERALVILENWLVGTDATDEIRALADTDGLALVQSLRAEVSAWREGSRAVTKALSEVRADRDRLAAANAALEAQVARLVGAAGVVVGEPLRGDETFEELFQRQLDGWEPAEVQADARREGGE